TDDGRDAAGFAVAGMSVASTSGDGRDDLRRKTSGSYSQCARRSARCVRRTTRTTGSSSEARRTNNAPDPDPRRLQHSVESKMHRDSPVSRVARLHDTVPDRNSDLAWRWPADARRLDLFTWIEDHALGCGETSQSFGSL